MLFCTQNVKYYFFLSIYLFHAYRSLDIIIDPINNILQAEKLSVYHFLINI